MDGSRLAAIGWSHRVAFEGGLADTIAWYRANEEWWRPLLNADWTAYYDRQYRKRLAESVPRG
jgi:dTDP-D-glucose 4,6-dehydratase